MHILEDKHTPTWMHFKFI